MGRGIVEPFDDLRDTNPAANQPLLDALTADFVEHDFNRKHIIRTIVNSRTYQASSKTNQWNKTDYRYFSRYYPRRLTAEQLVDALSDLTGIRENFASVPPGIRATQLPAPDLKKHDREKIGDIEFLKVFGMPERQTVCECERGDDSSLGQALELYNGKTLHGMLSDQNNRFHLAHREKQPTEAIVTDLYLRAFSREPNDEEKKIAVKYFESAKDKGQALEDIVWVAINRDEFCFNINRLSVVVASLITSLSLLAEQPVSFKADLAPILLNQCQSCHGPKKSKGGYRVDTFERAMEVGFDELHYRMVTDDEDEIMPPDADQLPAELIALFKRWQEEGETFDGDDPQASLAEIIPGLKHPDPPSQYSRAIPVTAVAFANGDQSVLTSGYHEMLVWAARDGKLQRRLSGLPERIHSIDIHPGGKQVAVAGGSRGVLVKSE